MEIGQKITLGQVTGIIIDIQDNGNTRRVSLQVNENKVAVVTLNRPPQGLGEMRLG